MKLSTTFTLAALALTTPMLCQAQDPVGSLAQVKQLAAAGKINEAAQLADRVITKFSGEGNLAKQYSYVVPFYLWEKATMYMKVGRYDEAVEAFKKLNPGQRWSSKEFLNTARASLPAEQMDYVEMYSTASIFQQGHARYKQAIGTDGKGGDLSKLDEAIKYLDEYLKLLEKGKVSKAEKKLKVESQVCFLLMQSCLLKPTPDFKKANEYLEKSMQGKGKLPDDMAIQGLESIVKVATTKPEYIDWAYKIIEGNPSSYNLGAQRSAKFAGKFLNMGIRVASLVPKFMQNNTPQGIDQGAQAARAASALFSIMPDLREVANATGALDKNIGKLKDERRPVISDSGTGESIKPEVNKKLLSQYKDFIAKGKYTEAYAIMTQANMYYQCFSSARLGRAGFQVIVDRYPDLQKEEKDPKNKDKKILKPQKDNNLYLLSQFCSACGDEAAQEKYQAMMDQSSADGSMKKSLAFGELKKLWKKAEATYKDPKASDSDKRSAYEKVIKQTDTVMEQMKDNKSIWAYACMLKLTSNFRIANYGKAIEVGNEFLKSEALNAKGEGAIKPAQVDQFTTQALYFISESYISLGKAGDLSQYENAYKQFEKYVTYLAGASFKPTTETLPDKLLKDKIAPNFYYGIANMLMDRGRQQEDTQKQDYETATKLCKIISDSWKDNPIAPRAALTAGNLQMFISRDGKLDKAVADEGKRASLALFDTARTSAFAMAEKDAKQAAKMKDVASQALFFLASYSADLKITPEETNEQQSARIQGYVDEFWSKADSEGNASALDMSDLALARACKATKDTPGAVEAFDAAVKKDEEIIAREATYAFKRNTPNSKLERYINSYVEKYTKGMATFHGKNMTLADKSEKFGNFPGLDPNDKYTGSIFRMAIITAMGDEMAAAKDPEVKKQLRTDMTKALEEMALKYRPDDLTNYNCVQVGDYLVKYVGEMSDPSSMEHELNQAIAYYSKVIERKGEYLDNARVGKAQALAYRGKGNDKQDAIALYQEVSECGDPVIMAPALYGMAENYMATGNVKQAIACAEKFLNNRQMTFKRLDMILLAGDAYLKDQNYNSALIQFMNVYNQNKGRFEYSIPACIKMMDTWAARNTPATGSRMKGDYKPSDAYQAWTTGKSFVELINRSVKAGGDKFKLTGSQMKLLSDLEAKVKAANTPQVQQEEKQRVDFANRVQQN
ncbi:MAG: tetratricopeptide repeat protein [Akkermansia muciniphila]|nr:tetratricopeptide repeat protein [Akkermansia muciniphila]